MNFCEKLIYNLRINPTMSSKSEAKVQLTESDYENAILALLKFKIKPQKKISKKRRPSRKKSKTVTVDLTDEPDPLLQP